MTPARLGAIRLRPRDCGAACWWLGLLYRRPTVFRDELRRCGGRERALVFVCLTLYVLPVMAAFCMVVRVLVYYWTDPEVVDTWSEVLAVTRGQVAPLTRGMGVGMTVGAALGAGIGLAAGAARLAARRDHERGWLVPAHGAADYLTAGLAMMLALGVGYGIRTAIGGSTTTDVTTDLNVGIPFGLMGAIAFAVSFSAEVGPRAAAIGGGVFGLVVGGVSDFVYKTLIGTHFGMLQAVVIEVSEGTAIGIAGGIAAAILGGLAFGTLGGIIVGVGFGASARLVVWHSGNKLPVVLLLAVVYGLSAFAALSRLYYHVIHPAFLWPRPKGRWYPRHPVAWDNLCSVAFPSLDRLLVAYAEGAATEAEAEITRLIATYPAQRPAALRARVILTARAAARETDLTKLDEAVARLPEGGRGILAQTRRLREMVHDIVVLQVRLNALDRPIFREPTAQTLCAEIENFQYRVSGFPDPLRSEFRAAAANWLEVARRQHDGARAVVEREPTPQVFRAGDPADRDKEAFVLRYGIVGEIERQVMLSTGCPGLVLYGRRRMGKSTLLYNLTGFLPPSVRPLTISMQNPEAFTSIESFVGLLTTRLAEVVPVDLAHDLPGFFRALSACDIALGATGRRLLLALDEYENIDEKIGAGVFSTDLLDLVRESIQRHRNLTWVFAGSHEITELEHAPWASYLVSARTIEVPMFTEAETCLLLTEPLRHSTLWPRDDPGRPPPHFAPGFWGDGGIERIHAEAGGWPHLVQLIAETVVDLLNNEGGQRVDAPLLTRAFDTATTRGHIVLYQLMNKESRLPGEWDYLSGFQTREAQPPPADLAIVRSLRRRLLIAEDCGLWRLRVPLMLRWLRARG